MAAFPLRICGALSKVNPLSFARESRVNVSSEACGREILLSALSSKTGNAQWLFPVRSIVAVRLRFRCRANSDDDRPLDRALDTHRNHCLRSLRLAREHHRYVTPVPHALRWP